ncbi:hypothetical protein [Rickettsiales endosymbiont of Stachyamoeba lipophora]|uniref:hypothetical protein n=1 Tax=Rickettsiales endosymbiont of Stachyamoeba lipophora TaxID=2486578 RepID=UPI000F64697E|nr:hypothetical protein [Rickettsiales endosymbiont of Stachyamoeba lipophora]AZL15926.1 hypothetical protein EF513_05145 [Rickettsiales endosymbiont of Stachyamoeba lipophora]
MIVNHYYINQFLNSSRSLSLKIFIKLMYLQESNINFTEEVSVCNFDFSGFSLNNLNLSGIIFENCIFNECFKNNFQNSSFEHCRFTSPLYECDMRNSLFVDKLENPLIFINCSFSLDILENSLEDYKDNIGYINKVLADSSCIPKKAQLIFNSNKNLEHYIDTNYGWADNLNYYDSLYKYLQLI